MPPLISLLQAVRYCERGAAPEFWAEPVNAITNAGYLAAALAGYALVRASRLANGDRRGLLALVALAASIGIGSAAFHTAPSPLTKLGDIIPIAFFVIAALYVALWRMLGLSGVSALCWLAALGAMIAMVAIGGKSFGCGDGTCLNGAPGYLPVLAALTATAFAARHKNSNAAPSLLLASLAFAAALAARTFDLAVCPLATAGGMTITAHAFWHLGTALVAYLVLRGLVAGLRVTS